MNCSPSVTRCETDFSSLLDSMRHATGGEGMTAEEIARQTGIGVKTVRQRLARALESGMVRRAKKLVTRIDGISTPVSSFVVCEPEKPLFPPQATL